MRLVFILQNSALSYKFFLQDSHLSFKVVQHNFSSYEHVNEHERTLQLHFVDCENWNKKTWVRRKKA